MNKLILFLKSTAGKVILVVLLMGISFYGGMEYKAYQIRSALGEVFSGFAEGVSEAFGNSKPDNVKEAKRAEDSNNLNKKVGFEITKKGFNSSGFLDEITFTFELTNNTNKDIEGVQGSVIITDIFGNEIKGINLAYDDGIPAGESILYSGAVDYNQFIDNDNKLKQTELSKLKYTWSVEQIIYTDGSME